MRAPITTTSLVGARRAACSSALLLGAMALLALGCAEKVPRRPAPPNALHFPASVAMTPDNRYLLVLSTNFDLLYDAGSITVVDLATHAFLDGSGIEIPSYGGVLRLRTASDGRVVGYVTDRTTDSLHWFTVERRADGSPWLRCGLDNEAPPRQASDVRECEREFRLRSAPSIAGQLTLGSDPFGLGIREPVGDEPALLFTGSLTDGVLGVLELDAAGRPTLIDAPRLGDAGLYGIATSPRNGLTYVATQLAQRLYAITTRPSPLAVFDPPAIDVPPPSIDDPVQIDSPLLDIRPVNLPNADSGASFTQTILFDPERDRAYVTFRAPPALAVVDTAPQPDGQPRNALLAWIPLGDRPSEMTLRPASDGFAAQLYVACFGSDEVYVLDTEALAVTDVIPTGEGPFGVAIALLPELSIQRAYVSLFDGNAVAVIELDRASAFYHQVVAHIR